MDFTLENLARVEKLLPPPVIVNNSFMNLFGMPIVECNYLPTKTFHIGTWLNNYKFGKGKNRSPRLQKKINKKYTTKMNEERAVEAFMFSGPLFNPITFMRPENMAVLINSTVS